MCETQHGLWNMDAVRTQCCCLPDALDVHRAGGACYKIERLIAPHTASTTTWIERRTSLQPAFAPHLQRLLMSPVSIRTVRLWSLINAMMRQNRRERLDRHLEKMADQAAASSERCRACRRTAAEAGMHRLLRCNACTLGATCRATYCNAACQKKDRPSHKAECRANKAK